VIKVKDEPKEHDFRDYGEFPSEFPPIGPFMKKFAFHCGPHHRRGKHFHGGKKWSSSPRTKVSRDHEKYTILIEIPGISKDDIELEVASDEIWLEARNEDTNKEYRRNLFLRKLIEPTMVKASIKAGLLTIVAPLVDKREKHKVDIDG
jgi:HSP20 family molecular chaperone IbpA